MIKFYEKNNLGVPATILCVIAYFIGYALTQSLSNLLVAVVFALVVFAFPSDERVKVSVKQSYTIAFVLYLVLFGFSILGRFIDMVTSISFFRQITFILTAYRNVQALLNITITGIFAILIILTLLKKDLKISFILKLLDES